MYENPNSQYSQLVMVVRKVETETPGSSVPEGRATSDVVDIDSKAKEVSSDTPYEVITQQIAYLLSAITNQNPNKNNGQYGSKCNNGNGKTTNTKTQGPKKDQKDMCCWGCGGTGHGWRECLTPRQGNNFHFKLANRNLNSQPMG